MSVTAILNDREPLSLEIDIRKIEIPYIVVLTPLLLTGWAG